MKLLATFEPTTTDGFLVSLVEINEDMLYREFYKQKSTYIFKGKKHDIYCLFNLSIICSESHALKIVSSMVKKRFYE